MITNKHMGVGNTTSLVEVKKDEVICFFLLQLGTRPLALTPLPPAPTDQLVNTRVTRVHQSSSSRGDLSASSPGDCHSLTVASHGAAPGSGASWCDTTPLLKGLCITGRAEGETGIKYTLLYNQQWSRSTWT
ncbi:unnamed protein product [Pleuronectes platessa]|uniref:Uncharacterized protein n=1 Tax=Pleuronectes platessa TaxID=8262 RepID=A0A9N7VFG7_PLEPL|nr:unnamed protein product [Pleuronectes platessa]